MRAQSCSYCGQPLPVHRMNVRMSPLEGRIFDLVMRGGEDGITLRDLIDIVWPDDPTPAAIRSLRVHVFNLNEKLALRGYRLIGYGSVYRLLKHTSKKST